MGGAELLLISLCAAMQNVTNTTVGNCTRPQDDESILTDDASLAMYNANNVQQPALAMPKELRITTLEDMPLSGTKVENGTLVGRGYAFYLLELLRYKLNFNYTIVPPQQNVLGDKKSGIFGQLFRKEVDMAVAFLPSMPEVRHMFKYSVALDEVEWTILMKRPQESATGSGLLAPFDTTVWILILVSLIVVGPTIYILIFIRSKISKEERIERYSLSTCMWFVYGALLKQGSTISPITDSARLLFATWWIFITILTSFYTANLTAFLTLSQFTLPINSVKDLAYKNQKWVTQKGRTIDVIVNQQHAELDLLKKSNQKGHGEFINLDDKPASHVLQQVTRNKMFLGEKEFVQSLIFRDYMNKTHHGTEESKRCTYVVMPGNILVKNRAFGFPLHSTIDGVINKHLLSLVEAGIIKHTTSADLSGTEICPLNLGSKERQLRNSDLSMTYKVVFIGFTVAIVAFVGEVVYRCKRKHDRDRKKRLPTTHAASHPLDFIKTSPPPLYQNIGATRDFAKKRVINGRDYYIITEQDGDKRLVPIRTPSAFLFQYAA